MPQHMHMCSPKFPKCALKDVGASIMRYVVIGVWPSWTRANFVEQEPTPRLVWCFKGFEQAMDKQAAAYSKTSSSDDNIHQPTS